MLPHPQASPASSTSSTASTPQSTSTTTTTSRTNSPNSDSSTTTSNWSRRDANNVLEDSPTPSPRGLNINRGRNGRELSLSLDLNLNSPQSSSSSLLFPSTETSSEDVEEGIEILSSGLEQLAMDSLSNSQVIGQRRSENWLTRANTIDGLIDNDLIEEHWYSMSHTPATTDLNEVEEDSPDSLGRFELIAEGGMVEDEACFVDCLPNGVDFISSLPYELSLYILLHLERSALLASTLVSRQWRFLALDNLIWRDLFHRESRWRIREDINTVNKVGEGFEDETASGNVTGSGTPLRRNGSIADSLRGLGSGSLSMSSSLLNEQREETISTATPRRPASGFLTNPFSPQPLTANTSINNGTSSTTNNFTPFSSSSLSSSTTLQPPPLRRASSATIPPLGFVPSPSFGSVNPNAPLFLDWPRLYKDRFILEKRWEKGQPKASWLTGHTDSVYCIQYDAGKVVSGSRDQTIRVWDIKTGECKKVLRGHSGSVLCLQYDDKVLVSGSSDSRVLIWDLVGDEETGNGKWEIKASLLGHQMGVLDLCFDDKWIVTCSKDTTIRVWHKETGQHYRTLSGHRGPINALQLLNDKVVSASGDGTMKLWSVLTGEVIRVFTGHSRGLACVQYSPSGKLLASGSNDRTIKIWDVETGTCLRTFKGHKELVRTLCFDETRRRLVSGSYDHSIKVWDLDTGTLLLSHAGHASLVFDVSFSASRIVSCSHDHKILILDFGYGLNVSKFI